METLTDKVTAVADEPNIITTWVCPPRVEKKAVAGGCGGNWGVHLPEKCPTCGGPLLVLQKTKVVNVK